MNRILILLVILFSCAERKKIEYTSSTLEHPIGTTNIKLRIIKNDHPGFVFVNLHHDETTAAQTTMKIIETNGGNLIRIENNNNRNIEFNIDQQTFKFDPNRMFTPEGRKLSLTKNGNYSEPADKEVEGFANKILDQVRSFHYILSIHNNTDGNYSVADYSGKLKQDAAQVHINPQMDSDDFVFTTNPEVFNSLRSKNINAVLQDNALAADDGSLSVYAGRNRLKYANIETEHGHSKEQERLIKEILKLLK
jgi:hypothetical protein